MSLNRSCIAQSNPNYLPRTMAQAIDVHHEPQYQLFSCGQILSVSQKLNSTKNIIIGSSSTVMVLSYDCYFMIRTYYDCLEILFPGKPIFALKSNLKRVIM